MLLTKECDYAIRVIRALSDHERKTVKMICDKEHVPFNFAYKILKKLEHEGIVCSIRGINGGYQLLLELNKISIYDIINSVSDNLIINECLREGHVCPNNVKGKRCAVHEGLAQIQGDLIKTLKSKTMDMFV